MSIRNLSRIGLVLLVLLAAGAAFAQDTGSVRGTVNDSTGAIVPGATVTLTNEATKFARNVVTDAKGDVLLRRRFARRLLDQGEIPGFKTSERKGMRISQREAAGFDFTLEVGAQTRAGRGHGAARADPDADRRPRGPADVRADRQPVGRRPQPARAAAHPPRLGHARRQLARERRQPDRRLEHEPGRPVRRQRHPRLEHRGHPRRLAPRRLRLQQRRHRRPEQRHGVRGQGAGLELRGRVRLGRCPGQRDHQGRQLGVPRHGVRLHPRLPLPGERPLELATPIRRGRRASSSTPAAT